MEARGLLLVKGTQSDEAATPALKLDPFADDLSEVCLAPDALNGIGRDHGG
jgi:hypothetical protein